MCVGGQAGRQWQACAARVEGAWWLAPEREEINRWRRGQRWVGWGKGRGGQWAEKAQHGPPALKNAKNANVKMQKCPAHSKSNCIKTRDR